MNRGMIEYLAVATEGKRHESVLLVEAEPLHVHLALLLLGLEPGPRPRFQGDGASVPPSPTAGQSSPGAAYEVNARVEWRTQGRDFAARLEELAWDIPARRPMASIAWVFTGVSPPHSGPRTMEERSVVATYRDPDAVLNTPLPTGADDTIYKVNERLVPRVGTPVTLWLSPAAG
jgi:hypothetical protein